VIRVLIVDDSVVVRRMLSDALTGDPRISVVGTAPTGAIALQKLRERTPDVVILDVEMPEMDGIETVRRLRLDHPKLPVIMCSSLTERGAEVTLRALSAGATDYVTKPVATTARHEGLTAFTNELLTRVLLLGGESTLGVSLSAPAPGGPSLAPQSRRVPAGRVAAIGIGSSTGGPNALAKLFACFPPDLPVPILIVQHMPPVFTRMLADSLTASSGVSVHEAVHGGPVEPGHAYVAPGDFHMVLTRQGTQVVTLLNQEARENSCRPAVDVLFRSLASVYGNGVLGCVLTGMGSDGARGARDIVAAGGTLLVQSTDSCVVSSMPANVARAGCAELALPPERLGDELVARVHRSFGENSRTSRSAGTGV